MSNFKAIRDMKCPRCEKPQTLQHQFDAYKKQNPNYKYYRLTIGGEISSNMQCHFEMYIKIDDHNELALRTQNGLFLLLDSKPTKWRTEALLTPENKIEFMAKASKDVDIVMDCTKLTFVGV